MGWQTDARFGWRSRTEHMLVVAVSNLREILRVRFRGGQHRYGQSNIRSDALLPGNHHQNELEPQDPMY